MQEDCIKTRRVSSDPRSQVVEKTQKNVCLETARRISAAAKAHVLRGDPREVSAALAPTFGVCESTIDRCIVIGALISERRERNYSFAISSAQQLADEAERDILSELLKR